MGLVGNYPLPPLDLKDAKGKEASLPKQVTLVKFWASWCPSCHKDLTLLPKQLAVYKKANISVTLVNTETDENPASPVAGLESLHASQKGLLLLQSYLDSHHVLQREIAFPFSLLLDAQGNVITIYFGSTTSEQVIQDAELATAKHTDRYLASSPYEGTIFDANLRAVHNGMAKKFQGKAPQDYIWKLREAGMPFFGNTASYNLAHAFTAYRLRKQDEALSHAEKALTQTKDQATLIEAQQLLGAVYFNQKKMPLARQHFIESIKIKPNPTAHYHLGLIDAELGKLSDAEKHLQLSIRLALEEEQHFPDPWNALHKLLLHQQKHKLAKELRALGIQKKVWQMDQ